MRCRTAHTAIIAARHGELGSFRRRALDRHLARCGSCRAERVAIDGVLAALDRLPETAEVPARLEQDVMRRVRILADEEAPGPSAVRWPRILTPVLATGAVAAAVVLGVRTVPDRDPTASRDAPVVVATRDEAPARARRGKTRVPDEPPAELASRPELFVDFEILRDMDKLQHFDAIATMEDDPTDAEPPSNG